MAVTPNSVVTPQTPKRSAVQIVAADASNQKTLYTAGSNGSKITGMILQSNDTSPRDILISITRSATVYNLGCVTVPIGAGNSGAVPSVNGLSAIVGLPVDSDGNPYLFLESGDSITIASTTTVTAAKTLNANAIGADF